jgi:hypothetical protein
MTKALTFSMKPTIFPKSTISLFKQAIFHHSSGNPSILFQGNLSMGQYVGSQGRNSSK